MELFIDSADIELIKKFYDLSIFKGITTTPTFFYKQKIYDYENEIKKIGKIIEGQIHIEAIGKNVKEIVDNAKYNNSLGSNIVSKIPISAEGIQAVKILKEYDIKTNIHLIFSLNQAVLAARSGADYICPLIGRMNDIGGNGFDVLANIINMIKGYGFDTKVMASSIRNPEDVTKSLLLGVDAITLPPDIISMMFIHPLTNIGVNNFQKDIQLCKKVSALMKTSDDMPFVNENSSFYETLTMMTEKKIGIGIIVDKENKLKGIITDGDIRRILIKSRDSINKKVHEVMNDKPITVAGEISAADALNIMEENRVTILVVVNDKRIPVGYIGIHDILGPLNFDYLTKHELFSL